METNPAPTFLLSLLWVVAGGTTIYYVNWLYESHSQVLAENVATIRAAGAMQDTLWRLQANLMEFGQVGGNALRTRIAELETAFEEYLSDAEQTALTAEEKVLVGQVREQFAPASGVCPTGARTRRQPRPGRSRRRVWLGPSPSRVRN